MIQWTAIAMICLNPLADSCYMISSGKTFNDELNCKYEAEAVAEYLQQTVFMARGYCAPIKPGIPS